ncbi:MAG: hypothetical protein M0D55_08555 [Elusimicrobiota bacterium]|nr:MAG: hypothetical protein M0D55_08555 [Elusimicrobiota bacterium]
MGGRALPGEEPALERAARGLVEVVGAGDEAERLQPRVQRVAGLEASEQARVLGRRQQRAAAVLVGDQDLPPGRTRYWCGAAAPRLAFGTFA